MAELNVWSISLYLRGRIGKIAAWKSLLVFQALQHRLEAPPQRWLVASTCTRDAHTTSCSAYEHATADRSVMFILVSPARTSGPTQLPIKLMYISRWCNISPVWAKKVPCVSSPLCCTLSNLQKCCSDQGNMFPAAKIFLWPCLAFTPLNSPAVIKFLLKF